MEKFNSNNNDSLIISVNGMSLDEHVELESSLTFTTDEPYEEGEPEGVEETAANETPKADAPDDEEEKKDKQKTDPNRKEKGKGVEVAANGALCRCSCCPNMGTLHVTSQVTALCNGATRLVATTGDKDVRSLTFGSCPAKHNVPCTPSITWSNFYDKVTIGHSLNILTKDSKGTCPLGGGQIQFVTSGQQMAVNPKADTDTDKATATATCPLLQQDDFEEEPTPEAKAAEQAAKDEVEAAVAALPPKEQPDVPADKIFVTNLKVNGKKQITGRSGQIAPVFTYQLTPHTGDTPPIYWKITRNGKVVVSKQTTMPTASDFTVDGQYNVYAYAQRPGNTLGKNYVKITVASPTFVKLEWYDGNFHMVREIGRHQQVNAMLTFKNVAVGSAAEVWLCQKGKDAPLLKLPDIQIMVANSYVLEITLDDELYNRLKALRTRVSLHLRLHFYKIEVAKLERTADYPIALCEKEGVISIALYKDDACRQKLTAPTYWGDTLYARVCTRGGTSLQRVYLCLCSPSKVAGTQAFSLFNTNEPVSEDGVTILKIALPPKNKSERCIVLATTNNFGFSIQVTPSDYTLGRDKAEFTAYYRKNLPKEQKPKSITFVQQLMQNVQQLFCLECVCRKYNLLWDDNVSCEFRKKVVEICRALWGTRGEEEVMKMANGLMAVMAVETNGTFSACIIAEQSKPKDRKEITESDFIKIKTITKKDGTKTTTETSKAVGLIQFTQNALVQMGEFKNGQGLKALNALKLSYARMSNEAQLDKVKKYFENSTEKIKTPEDIYLHIFAPIGVGAPDDKILYKSGTDEYNRNSGVDQKDGNGCKDGRITRGEILNRYRESVDNGKGYRGHKYECGAANKTQEATNGWHDPVDNPQITYFSQGGYVKPWNQYFGYVRDKSNDRLFGQHAGTDLFAVEGTNVYACLDGVVVSAGKYPHTGNMITLKITDPKQLEIFRNRRRSYTPIYPNKGFDGERSQGVGFDPDSKSIYFVYMHLSKMYFKAKDKVKAGQIIGLSGITGVNGTKGPHVHFEIRSDNSGKIAKTEQDRKLQNRTNPAFYVYFMDAEELKRNPALFKAQEDRMNEGYKKK